MYNCNSWAAAKQLLHKFDVCHRNHLRSIIGMTYPDIIRNETFYKRVLILSTVLQGGPKKRPIVFQDLITALVVDIFARNFQR